MNFRTETLSQLIAKITSLRSTRLPTILGVLSSFLVLTPTFGQAQQVPASLTQGPHYFPWTTEIAYKFQSLIGI